MQILVKFPTRERPNKFILCLRKYIDLQTTKDVSYIITLDKNDPLLLAYTNFCETLKAQGVNIKYVVGESTGKINAVNRDLILDAPPWEILVLASDDMECQQKGWDEQLIKEMTEAFPDTDGVLFHNDGFLGNRLNTMCILGRKYFRRFGYIYHPDYVSLWCDNEFMDVANRLGKQKYFESVLFKHEHPMNVGAQEDKLGKHNESFYYQDKATFEKRKQNNYGL